jgi:hypothetical protein
MNATLSPLQLYTTRNFNGLTEQNHLSNAFLTEPEKVGAIMAYAFGFAHDNVLSLLTGGIGNTMEISNREYQWALHAQNDRAIEVTGNLSDGGSTPGIAGSTFRVKFGEKFFEQSDNLVSDDGTQVRVQFEPYQDGNSYVYTLQLTSADQTKFIDAAQIAAGARFSKDYSTVEEYSSKGGGTHYATPFQLRNQLTTLRKHYEVTRSAATDVMIIELPDPMNPKKKTKLWVKLAEWTAIAQWYREVDRSYIYSEYNKDSLGMVYTRGLNGRPVYTGAGLRQQIAPANVRYYNQLTHTILDDFLLDLSYSAQKEGGNHKFVALTGKMGMREFDRAITEKAKGLGFLVLNEGKFISGSGQELTFEGQFKTVKFLNGVELTVKEFAPYDDIVRNRTLHPRTKKPLESYRFSILNFGTTAKGEANIVKVCKKDSDLAMWHVCGSTDPMGGVAKSISTMRSSGIDGYEVHMLSECGLMVKDPTSCGELIMSLD